MMLFFAIIAAIFISLCLAILFNFIYTPKIEQKTQDNTFPYNHLEVLGFDKLKAYMPYPETETKPAPAFDFDTVLSSSFKTQLDLKEQYRAEVLSGPYFQKAIQFIAEQLSHKADHNIIINSWTVDLWEKENDIKFRIFKEEFTKICNDRGITVNEYHPSFLSLDRDSLNKYKEKLNNV